MIITLEENTTVLDFCLMVKGSLDNIYETMFEYGISSLDEDLTGRTFDVTFNTDSAFVNHLFVSNTRLTTGDIQLFNTLNNVRGPFSGGFGGGFNV